MHISRIRISNILGIEELEFEAGAFNLISGSNGAGKTSVLEAIKSVAKGGEDATLMRNGADRGEIVFLLDDGSEIKKRVTPGGVSVTVERDGVRQDKPQTVIKALTDVLSVNPVDFLRAPKKQRVSALLEALPVQLDQDKLAEIAGEAAKVADPDRSALERIDAVYKAVFDDRTGTNRAVREKEATINQLKATLPSDAAEVAPGDDEATLTLRLENIDTAETAEMDRITTKLDGMRREQDETVEKHRTRIDELRKEIDQENAAIQAAKDSFREKERLAEQQRDRSKTRFSEQRAPVRASLEALRRDAGAQARASQTRETMSTLRKEADRLAEDAERQTQQLEQLTTYKSDLLASLPIDGLAVVDGEIFRHEVPFDRLNSAQQVEIAVEIAKLRAGELGVICVDGIELLDGQHFEHFREKALASGLQLFVTRVTNGPFEVTTQ